MAIETKKQRFPCTKDWDDFLDFSRMRVPTEEVIAKRLVENCVQFSGNYIWVWIVITLLYGIVNWKILGAFMAIAFGWFAAEILYLQSRPKTNTDETSERKQWKTPQRSSSKYLLGVILAVDVLYEFSVLFQVILALFSAAAIAIVHALSRPVVNEHYLLYPEQHKMPPSVHSNVRVMDDGEEDELTFSQDSTESNYYPQNLNVMNLIKQRSKSQW
mmetsp:Transcript_8035/g.17204  ORF Transcript_8035/g.17204 Transcript_8035/m.17204 type:complete len:216 (+) Transcript_8035:74-721(+)